MFLKNIFSKKFIPAGIVFCSFVVVAFLVRLILMFYTGSKSHMNLWEYPVALCIGLLYDIVVGFFVAIPFVIYVWFQNEFIYKKKIIPYILGSFVLIICLLIFTNIFPKEFNEDVFKIFTAYIIFRFLLYCTMAFMPLKFRQKIRIFLIYSMLAIFFVCLFFNAASEYFFWNEFSTRYNFIAVDYLIYTNEVIGNIKESYPIGLLITFVVLATGASLFLYRKYLKLWINSCELIKVRSLKALLLLALPALFFVAVKEPWHKFSKNQYANEFAGNGIYQFATAFINNDLDFYKFYKSLPNEEAFAIVREALNDSNSTFVNDSLFSIERNITSKGQEQKKNVVLISVESLSGDFMKHFGNTQNITPYLDSLADVSMFFTNLYASGTRTVRGLEALSLGLPPVPGQSIVKRPNNANMFTLGGVFKSKGYTTQYIYGGYSYFDNMKTFFGGNGYDVIDRDSIAEKDIHYQNIWGVADEDEFALAIKTLDKNAALNKPFFTQIMTVSNHRPFTYPEGRIDLPAAKQEREGAVKYTDYCINKFLKESSTKPWYNNTVFVIVSDHCASVAGSAELPVNNYHIPLIIFSPANVKPSLIKDLTAQIDIAPTLLGLLNFNYKSKFFGQDVLNTTADKRRAFVSTYQGLGFIKNDTLVIQSPVKKVKTYKPNFVTGEAVSLLPNERLEKQAIAFYQVAAWLVQEGKYNNY